METPLITDTPWVLPLCILILALPIMILSTTSSRAVSALGLARARYLVDEGQKKFEPFVRAPNEYWMTIHILDVIGVVGMFWSGYTLLGLLSVNIAPWATWLILAAIYFSFHSVLGVQLARGDEREIAGRMLSILKPFHLCLRPLTWLLSLALKPVSRSAADKFADAERIEEELEVMLDESTRQGGLEDIKGRIM
ncbi:MAG: DUF21 domain-containing protein, partial [Proteobacteria bacterium]|nr:DUF21 domain-containing protein [Pseudomonadota bacterium]